MSLRSRCRSRGCGHVRQLSSCGKAIICLQMSETFGMVFVLVVMCLSVAISFSFMCSVLVWLFGVYHHVFVLVSFPGHRAELGGAAPLPSLCVPVNPCESVTPGSVGPACSLTPRLRWSRLLVSVNQCEWVWLPWVPVSPCESLWVPESPCESLWVLASPCESLCVPVNPCESVCLTPWPPAPFVPLACQCESVWVSVSAVSLCESLLRCKFIN